MYLAFPLHLYVNKVILKLIWSHFQNFRRPVTVQPKPTAHVNVILKQRH